MADPELSHEETWDDSYLVSSWNEALDEYKKYHSIAVKGENVDELIRELQQQETQAPSTEPLRERHDRLADRKLSIDAQAGNVGLQKPNETIHPDQTTTIPQAILSTVQDDNMRNLMMSWYYAGYYTGYHDGQQKAHADLANNTAGV